MRPSLPFLLAISAGIALPAAAQTPRGPSPFSQLLGGKEDANNGEETESDRTIPAISLLPEGSILENVLIPRYDRDRKLSSVLRSRVMVLEKSDVISGETVSIESYNSDRSLRARIDLAKAIYDQRKSLLRADRKITISSDRVIARGTGLIYSLDSSRGFLHGPATTILTQPPVTAMNPAKPALRATALLGASFLPLIAAPPAAPTAEEKARIERDAASMAGQAAEAGKTSRNDLRAVLQSSEAANKAALEFLDQADLLASAGTAEAPAGTPPPPELKLPDATVIRCGGGMYFDPDLSPTESVLVYLKGVNVTDPRFTLKSQELKVFFEKTPAAGKDPKKDKPAAPEATVPPAPGAPQAPGKDPKDDPKKADKKDDKKQADAIGGMDFGDPRRVVATGAVVIDTKAQGDNEPVRGAGAFFSYDLKTGDIVLRGGSGGNCWFIQGDKLMKALQPNLGIRINRNGQVYADNGPWETLLVIPQNQN